MTKPPKDLFSADAVSYANFRPTYPDAIFRFLASIAHEHRAAWDAGCGNGQAALKLAQHFDHVFATDVSAQQLKEAPRHERISYHVARAEQSLLESSSIDLITVAQAYHWFDEAAFTEEVMRVTKKNGVLALWCYGLVTISETIDKIIRELCYDVLGDYWEPERALVETNYRTVTLPFSPLPAPSFLMTAQWSLDHLIGYLTTWSALKKYVQVTGKNPITLLHDRLARAYAGHEFLVASWNITPRIWRLY